MPDVWKSACGLMELRCGDWREVLAGVTCDAVITDPPYSPRQAEGFRTNVDFKYARQDGARSAGGAGKGGSITAFQGMPYAPISEDITAEMAGMLTDGASWFVAFGDHISFRWWESALAGIGWYTFAPVIWDRGSGCRFQGDGPGCAVEFILVARPRKKTACGSLPGIYRVPPLRGEATATRIVTGQKPVALMRQIVRDYSRPGDLICDPCAGGGTTLLAAALEGRRAIGAEIDPVTYAKAVKRLSAGYTPQFDFSEATSND